MITEMKDLYGKFNEVPALDVLLTSKLLEDVRDKVPDVMRESTSFRSQRTAAGIVAIRIDTEHKRIVTVLDNRVAMLQQEGKR